MIHSFASRINVAPNVLFHFLGEETILLNLNTERYLGLDSVGTRMWKVLTEAPSIQAACDMLVNEYQVTPESLQLDLDEFVDTLLEQGLIEIGPHSEQ
jgi:hypothetical protein